jgi:peptidoglycan/LPS O-acetylase OafA/YrhL
VKHRAEIDGLRAVAVLPVLLFHTGYEIFAGGYLGVDVFFVISGYLITSIIDGEMREGRFSFIRFYERRARRILPALVAMTLACIAAGLWLMTPTQLYSMALTVGALTVFASNILYALQDSYFAESNLLDPLIHTWSLAIEEQYYVVAPVIMLVLWRAAPRLVVHAFVVIAVGTLLYAESRTRGGDQAAYYLLTTRAWELAAGGLLALAEARTGRTSRVAAWGAGLGLLAMLASFAMFSARSPHPGFATLLPVGGAAAVIWFCDGRDAVSRLLSSRVLVGIGLISYSLYLWHQPVYAFARLHAINDLAPPVYVPLILLSLALAAASWRFVEQPFRNRAQVGARPLWLSAGASVVGLIALALIGIVQQGLPQRFPADLLAVIETEKPVGYIFRDGRACHNRQIEDACVIGADAAPTWAVIGDSHPGSIAVSIERALADAGLSAIIHTTTGCVYAPDMTRGDGSKCLPRNAALRDWALGADLDTIVLMGRYVRMMEHERYDNGEGGVESLGPALLRPAQAAPGMTEADRRAAVAAGYRRAVEELLEAGKRVVLIYPVPEIGWNVPRTLHKMRRRGDETPISVSRESFEARAGATIAAFDAIPDHPRLVRVRAYELWCDTYLQGRCAANWGDEVFYMDDNHPSILGGDRIMALAMRRLNEAR